MVEDGEEEDDLGVDRPDKVLIKMRLLTAPGNLFDSAELKTWASSDPEMKVVRVLSLIYRNVVHNNIEAFRGKSVHLVST